MQRGETGSTSVSPFSTSAARAGRPILSLVEAGRGEQPQDPDATLPALYIAGNGMSPTFADGRRSTAASPDAADDGAADDALRIGPTAAAAAVGPRQGCGYAT